MGDEHLFQPKSRSIVDKSKNRSYKVDSSVVGGWTEQMCAELTDHRFTYLVPKKQ